MIGIDGPIVNLRSIVQSLDRRSPDEVSLAHASVQLTHLKSRLSRTRGNPLASLRSASPRVAAGQCSA
jgi:hypothetical protein